jgi:hypothetical protein
MLYRRRLRSRIILSFLLLGFGLAVLIASATVYLRATVERKVIGQALVKNVDDYANGFYTNPDKVGVPFEKISGVVYGINKIADVPAAWRALSPGMHELQEADPEGAREPAAFCMVAGRPGARFHRVVALGGNVGFVTGDEPGRTSGAASARFCGDPDPRTSGVAFRR